MQTGTGAYIQVGWEGGFRSQGRNGSEERGGGARASLPNLHTFL